MHGDVSKAVTESIRMGTSLWEGEASMLCAFGREVTSSCLWCTR
jgi:hypothetical protein